MLEQLKKAILVLSVLLGSLTTVQSQDLSKAYLEENIGVSRIFSCIPISSSGWVASFSTNNTTEAFFTLIQQTEEGFLELTPVRNSQSSVIYADCQAFKSNDPAYLFNFIGLEYDSNFNPTMVIVGVDNNLNYTVQKRFESGLLFEEIKITEDVYLDFMAMKVLTNGFRYYQYSYDVDLELAAKDSIETDTPLYISDYLKINSSRTITCSTLFPFIFDLNFQENRIDTFWSYSPTPQNGMSQASINFSQIVDAGGQLLYSGIISIDRAPGPGQLNWDSDVFIAELGLDTGLAKIRLFGSRDTLLAGQVYDYHDDAIGVECIIADSIGNTFVSFATKSSNTNSINHPSQNRIELIKLDENLDTVWSTMYQESEARLFPIGNKLLPDGSLFVFCDWKRRGDTTAPVDQLLVLHFNKNGYLVKVSPRANKPSDYKLYPNPTNNLLNVESNRSIDDIAIRDIHGKVVLNWNLTENQIDVSNLKPGIYLIEILEDQNRSYQRFIKE
jgi:hypothetical protein